MVNIKILLTKILNRINSSNRQVLLWTNPNPTTNQAATTLTSTDLTDLPKNYDNFLIVAEWNTANYTDSRLVPLNRKLVIQEEYNVSSSSSDFIIKQRTVTVSDDSISISACTSKTASSATSYSTTNAYLIVYKIYGIKGGV